MLISPLCSF